MAYSSAPMYSMGTSQRGDEMKHMSFMKDPGPGTYEFREEKQSRKSAPSWRMGSSQRAPLYTGTKTPGPGEYDVRGKKLVGPKFSMTKAKKDFEFRTGMGVGPGSYNPDKVPNRPPSFTFGYKDSGNGDRAKTPGPGEYPLRSTLNASAPKFTKSTRDELYQGHLGPGPGKYFNADVDSSTQHFFTPKWKFGTSTRDDLYRDAMRSAPGPGKYESQGSIKTNKGFSLVPKRPIQARVTADETPGPGHYKQQVDPLRHTAPAFRIGKSERKNLAMGSPDIPGPGAHFNELPSSMIGAKIGTSERPGLHPNFGKQVPGPGAYDIRKPFVPELKEHEKSTNFPKMGIKYNVKKNTDTVPGPGAYEPFGSVYMEKNSGPVIGTSRRPEARPDKTTPGPGDYKIIKESFAPHPSFGKAKKNNTIKPSEEPGPGSYNIPPAFGNVPKYLLPRQRSESAV